MANKPILYSYFRSTCSYRVRIALAHKGIDYECRAVNLLKGEQLGEDFLKINPCGEVPVLVDGDRKISHSSAILEYLEETAPGPSLLPRDPYLRSQVRGVVDSIVSGIQPIQNLRVLKYVGPEKKTEWGRYWIDRGLRSVERVLQDTHGLYCFGDEVTLADVCLLPQVYNAKRFEVDMSPFPLISEICARLESLNAFKIAHPSAQPDCPEELRI